MHRAWVFPALFLVPLLARGADSPPAVTDRTTVSLLAETDSYRPGQALRLGLHFRLAPGWHIYWKNPGDAGSPPELDWTLPPGARAGAIDWPAPEREAAGPVTSYVYTGEVVLPVRIVPPPGEAPFALRADASWVVCARICVPEEGHFGLTLPPGPAGPSAAAPLFAAADARMPRASPFAATLAPDGYLRLSGQGLSPATVRDAWFFPAAWGSIDQNAPQSVEVGQDGLALRLAPGPRFDPAQPVEGVLVLQDPKGNESALDIRAIPAPATAPASPATSGLPALLLAFAGGVMLNLMPCVFPVLAMKALAVARLAGRERRVVRGQALSYTAGVLAAFLALGGALLAGRAAGASVGWGGQFQSPAFVAGLAWLLFALGLNLSGVYAVRAPFAGTGQGLAGRDGLIGSFGAGLLAVVVATPCTAPFMGSAMAAAVTAPAWLGLGIFACLGLGLAAPYVLLAAAPGMGALLPRPGAWMEVLRQALAFPLYGAVIWLVWVSSRQSGSAGVLAVCSGLGLLGLAFWALGLSQRAAAGGGRAAQIVAAAAGIATLALLPALDGIAPAEGRADTAAADGSEPFSESGLAALRAAGRPVFVDMTAAWCVTCLVNERVALDSPERPGGLRGAGRGLSERRLDRAGSRDHPFPARGGA